MNKTEITKCGYVTIVGRPNVGKSTLLNLICNQNLAAVSAKPQTTRHKITGILNIKNAQIIFIDTPGLHQSDKKLNKYLNENVDQATLDADVVCFLVEPRHNSEDEMVFKKIKNKKFILIINKFDTLLKSEIEKTKELWRNRYGLNRVHLISALENKSVDGLVNDIIDKLPDSSAYYPDDMGSTLNLRFICSELIRQEVFNQMHQEIPYSTAVQIEKFDESKKPVVITAAIIVERDTQKAMIIGNKGVKIKEIGVAARKLIEEMVGKKVYLDLFVGVEKNWTKDERKLKEFLSEV